MLQVYFLVVFDVRFQKLALAITNRIGMGQEIAQFSANVERQGANLTFELDSSKQASYIRQHSLRARLYLIGDCWVWLWSEESVKSKREF